MVGADGDPESGAGERCDRVGGRPGHVGERDRAGAGGVAEQVAAGGGPVGRRVAEGHVHAAADGDHVAAAAQAGEQAVTALRVLLCPGVVGLHPQQRLMQTRVGLGAEQLAVEVDADLEARVGGHDLHRGRAAQGVPDDPDVTQVEVTGQRRAAVVRGECGEPVEHEAGVGGADVDQPLELRVRRGTHHVGVHGLADDPSAGEHRGRRLVRGAQRDDHEAAAGQLGAQGRVLLARHAEARREDQDRPRRAAPRLIGASNVAWVSISPKAAYMNDGSPPTEPGSWSWASK